MQVYETYRDRGVVFIGLTGEGESSLSGIRQFVEGTGVPWVNGYGANETLTAFKNTYTPQTWVLGPDGRVAWNQASKGDVQDGIERALAMREGSNAMKIED